MAAPNEHFYEQQVIRDLAYVRTVEAAMMQVAFTIVGEPNGNRRTLALAVILNPLDRVRFAEAFAWMALYNPAIRGQVFTAEATVAPDRIDGVVLRKLITDAWNTAANVNGGGNAQ